MITRDIRDVRDLCIELQRLHDWLTGSTVAVVHVIDKSGVY